MSIIQTATTLLPKTEEYLFIDVRTKHQPFSSGQEAYETSHIKDAIFLDLKADLTGEMAFLPESEPLAEKLGASGVSRADAIVLYDQGNQRAASKAWYVFKYLGHEKVYILQGGFPAWEEADGPVAESTARRQPTAYQVNLRPELAAAMADVKERLAENDVTLIDSRGKERYRGDAEPKYKKAGHIPGAKNYQAKDVFTADGKWKSQADLQQHFQGINPDESVIVSCGSGNSACMNFVALKEAGFHDVRLFSGGFSEWIEDDANDVATGDE